MISSAPTIVAIETNSAWVVILAVSLVTLPLALFLRRLIDRPGALASSILLGLPLVLPLVAAMAFQKSVLPEVSVLRPLSPGNVNAADWNLLHLLFVRDGTSEGIVPYVFSGGPGRWILLVGVAFSTFMLLRRLAGTIVLKRLVSRCDELDEVTHRELLERVDHLARAAGLKRAPVVLLLPDDVKGAFVIGGRTPRILISLSVIEALAPDELDAILAHEIAHIMARDVPVTVVAGLLRDLVAWNPMAHLALRRLIAEREFEADRCAARLTGKPLAVASGLLKMCELVGRSQRSSIRATAAFLGRRAPLRRRVAHLLALADGRLSSRESGYLPYIAAAALAVVLGLQAGSQVAQQADFAIVWDAHTTESVPVWSMQRREPVAGGHGRSGRGRKSARRQNLAASVNFENGYALREQDVSRWIRSMASVAKTEGLPRKVFVSGVGRGLEAVPVFSQSSFGRFGFYRLGEFEVVGRPGPHPK